MVATHHVEPLISSEEIQKKIQELARKIVVDYQNQEIVLVGILHGGATLIADLGRALWELGKHDVFKDYIGISSYESETESSGNIRITKELKNPIKDRHVLIVEDIVDTGRSLKQAIETLSSQGAKSIKTLALLSKKERREIQVPIEYVGFEIPNKFVVGYDLDYDEMYRTMPGIGVVVFD